MSEYQPAPFEVVDRYFLKQNKVFHMFRIDSRKLFRVVNSLCREPLETALPEHTDPTKLANEFGTFFLKKIEIIKENLDKFQVQESQLIPACTGGLIHRLSF